MRRRTFTPLVDPLEPRLALSGVAVDPEPIDPCDPTTWPPPPGPIIQPLPPPPAPPPGPPPG